MSTFQSWGDAALAKAKSPVEMSRAIGELVQKARQATAPQAVSLGVVLAECLGFFTVGEMIGRFKIVGYRGKLEPDRPH